MGAFLLSKLFGISGFSCFCHRAYSKTWKPRKIFTRSFFDYLSNFEHSPRHFVLSKHNLQSVAQSYQWAFTIIALKWLFWLLKPKSCLGNKLMTFQQFSGNGNRKTMGVFNLESFLCIFGISGFSFFTIEHIRKHGNHGKFW